MLKTTVATPAPSASFCTNEPGRASTTGRPNEPERAHLFNRHESRQPEALARMSDAARISAELMGSPSVRLFHDHVLVKEGGTRQRTPWHQDQPYYNVDGRGVSAWIPVDPVPEAGCRAGLGSLPQPATTGISETKKTRRYGVGRIRKPPRR